MNAAQIYKTSESKAQIFETNQMVMKTCSDKAEMHWMELAHSNVNHDRRKPNFTKMTQSMSPCETDTSGRLIYQIKELF